jgi:hypothetical protein
MDNFIKKLLQHRGFSNNIANAVEERTKRTPEEKEMEDRLLAEAMTKQMVNEMMPIFRQHLAKQQKAQEEKKVRKIIIPDDK